MCAHVPVTAHAHVHVLPPARAHAHLKANVYFARPRSYACTRACVCTCRGVWGCGVHAHARAHMWSACAPACEGHVPEPRESARAGACLLGSSACRRMGMLIFVCACTKMGVGVCRCVCARVGVYVRVCVCVCAPAFACAWARARARAHRGACCVSAWT
jgi:hypothetical protein